MKRFLVIVCFAVAFSCSASAARSTHVSESNGDTTLGSLLRSGSGRIWFVATTGNDTTGDGSESHPLATIQRGLDSAAAGDTVLVEAGTYQFDGNTPLSFLGKDLVLMSVDGAAVTIIAPVAVGNMQAVAFHFFNGESPAATVDGFTITGAHPGIPEFLYRPYGGSAIVCEGASPTIRNCVIVGNSGYNAGGVVCLHASTRILNCEIRSNTSQCGSGGGIMCDSSQIVVQGCLISDNWGFYGGGGVSVSYSQCRIDTCVLIRNAGSNGGAISAWASSIFLENNTIASNGCHGGYDCLTREAGHSNDGSEASKRDCDCAAIALDYPYVNYGSHAFVTRCIIAFNYSDAINWPLGRCDSVSTTDIYGNRGGNWVGCIAGQELEFGNMSSDPQFCDPSGDDYHLFAMSPCAPENNGGVLLGAVEVGTCDEPACCINGTGNVDCDLGDSVDISDLSAMVDYLFSITMTPLCCPGEANVDGQPGIDISDLSTLVDFLFISFTPPAACQ